MKFLLMLFILYLIAEEKTVAGRSRNKIKGKRPARIINGELTTIENYPFIVNVIGDVKQYRENERERRRWCGGSIISSNWVVSAAHCICNADRKNNITTWGVMPAVNDYGKEMFTGDMYLATRVFMHEAYLGYVSPHFDIALIKLVREFQFSKFIQPITIAGPNYQYKPGSKCMAAGYGLTASNFNKTWLRELNMVIVDENDCKNYYEESNTPEVVCAKHPTGAGKIFKGDSGGPLVQWRGNSVILIGIVSYGTPYIDDFHVPQVFTRIGFKELTKWIRKRRTGAKFYCKK